MISVVKYFILGASKVFDFTNRTRIYEIDYKNNIKKSWDNVGLSMNKRISIEKPISKED